MSTNLITTDEVDDYLTAIELTAEALVRIADTLERIEQEAVTFRRDTTHMLSQINSGVRAAKR